MPLFEIMCLMEKTADILWESCANGNNESFKSLFDTWYEPLCRYSCFFTGDSMDAEEVVLDFFMYIWHNRTASGTWPGSVELK